MVEQDPERTQLKTKDGRILNSDINGAYNILQKAFPKVTKTDGIEVWGLADEMMARGRAGQPAPSPVSKTSEFIK